MAATTSFAPKPQTTWTIPGTDIVLDEAAMEQRRRMGVDLLDEVWDGVIHVSPLANNDHQSLIGGLSAVLYLAVTLKGLGQVFPGVNVSDRVKGWRQNFRIPDLAVFLNHSKARNCDTHWCGGPDFAVEIKSPGDETLDKIPFYQQVGTRELLIIDRDPWTIVLYRLEENGLVPATQSELSSAETIASTVVPLTFRLVPGESPNDRPAIEVAYAGPDGQTTRLKI